MDMTEIHTFSFLCPTRAAFGAKHLMPWASVGCRDQQADDVLRTTRSIPQRMDFLETVPVVVQALCLVGIFKKADLLNIWTHGFV